MTDRPIIFSAPMVRAILEGHKTQTRRIVENVPNPPSDTVHASSLAGPRFWPLKAAPYLDAYCSEPRSSANPRGMSEVWCWWTRDDRMGAEFKIGWKPGDRLWVRERHYLTDNGHEKFAVFAADERAVREHFFKVERMRADPRLAAAVDTHARLRPSIHMPRWASRLTLIATDVRVQPLQEISPEDVAAEGIETAPHAAFDFAAGAHVAGYRYPNGGFGAFPGAHKEAYQQLWEQIHGPDAWPKNPWVAAITFRPILANIDAPEARAA